MKKLSYLLPIVVMLSVAALAARAGHPVGSGAVLPALRPAGEPLTKETAALQEAARKLQNSIPAKELGIYIVGFHPMKGDPEHQMEAHHFCKRVRSERHRPVMTCGIVRRLPRTPT